MEWAVLIVCSAVACTAAYSSLNLFRDRYIWRKTLMKLAAESGFEYVPSGTGQYAWARGSVNGFAIEIRQIGLDNAFGRTYTPQIVVQLTLSNHISMLPVHGRHTGTYGSGCTQFDEHVALAGPELDTLSYLDASTRSRMITLVAHGGRVENGALHFPVISEKIMASTLRTHVDRALQLAKLLSRKNDSIDRMILALQKERSPAVRDRFLGTLRENVPRDKRFFDLTRTLLAAPRIEERLLAIDVLGAEGVGVAEEILKGEAWNLDIKTRALQALVRGQTASALPASLRRVSQVVSVDLVPELVWACQATEDWSAFEILKARFGDNELTLKTWESDYLVATRPRHAEHRCLVLLADSNDEVATHAAQALGILGTIDALPDLAKRRNGPGSAELIRRCGEAAQTIRERIPAGEVGQLSVVKESNEGALSVPHVFDNEAKEKS